MNMYNVYYVFIYNVESKTSRKIALKDTIKTKKRFRFKGITEEADKKSCSCFVLPILKSKSNVFYFKELKYICISIINFKHIIMSKYSINI